MAERIRSNYGCIQCSGAACLKCKHWTGINAAESTDNELIALERGRWGKCAWYTANPEAPRRMYSGNTREYPWEHERELGAAYEVLTTHRGKCPHYE